MCLCFTSVGWKGAWQWEWPIAKRHVTSKWIHRLRYTCALIYSIYKGCRLCSKWFLSSFFCFTGRATLGVIGPGAAESGRQGSDHPRRTTHPSRRDDEDEGDTRRPTKIPTRWEEWMRTGLPNAYYSGSRWRVYSKYNILWRPRAKPTIPPGIWFTFQDHLSAWKNAVVGQRE